MSIKRTTRQGFFAAAAAAAIALTACGGGGNGGGDTTTEAGGGGTSTTEAGGDSTTEAGGGEELSGTVSVLGSWSGAEQDSFMAMVAPWEEETGVTVEYTGSRDLPAQITSGIAAGTLPDLAGIPGPGAMKDWADQGALKPLDFIDPSYAENTPDGFAELGEVDGQLMGVFTKAAVKGLIYFNTDVWDAETPATWDDLVSAADTLASETGATPWCVGIESGAASGWPATDWIEDIVLRQAGPDAYDQWVAGELAWSSPEIKGAFETFGEVLDNTYGGVDVIVNTGFGRAANPLFAEGEESCLLHHQASFITDFFQNEAGATPEQYDFFPFPDMNPDYAGGVVGAGDLFGMFNDTPEARSLINYLLTADAQRIWVERGGFLSANSGVALDSYQDEVNRRSAEILQNAEVFRFDGSDNMPAAVSDAFNKAMVDFAQNQDNLDSILETLDAAVADTAANS
ncbi:MAG: ABC transporter substrate-binding protein [bacterium]|nr:ABC transporter substrate-binding protein [bacterium]